MKLWHKILLAMILGLGVGSFLGPRAEILKPVGTIFLQLVNMIIVLLVFSSMTVGITSIHDPKKLGRIGLKTLLLYGGTTVISVGIGLIIALYFQVGIGTELQFETTANFVFQQPESLGQMLLSIIPTNPVASLVSGNILQIIIFSLFLGIAINFAGEKGRPLLELMQSLAEVMYRVTSLVMELSPFGVFAIMAWIAGTFGLKALLPLGKFLLLYYFACILHVLIVFVGMLRLMAKLKPGPFFKGMGDAFMVAFSTASSSATLPVSLHCVQENLGVSKNISSFVLPLGTTINMNGTAIYQGMCAIFISQVYGINLDLYSLLTIVLTATLSAVGTAGIPGSGFIIMSAVLTSVGLPLEGLGLLAGIDRLRDMASSVLNIMGDAVVAITIAKQEGELDESRYYNERLVELEGSET